MDLGEPGEWIPMLSHLMKSCPNLKQLNVLIKPRIEKDSLEKMVEFKDRVP
jgi:hypothetical protein